LKLKSNPALKNKTFSWSYTTGGRQDAVILRVCFKDDDATCVFEKKIVGDDLPLEFTIQPTFGNGDYLAYAFCQSNGVDSSYSEAAIFKVGKQEDLIINLVPYWLFLNNIL